ncbi:unnamed protein product [Brachionus calyciflorus]|uniref:FLYWCH-type domain-containing protein n=1 Tax=Brachionus calyciflorus TaxID=104777 RepID=A0A814PXV8_9BILA|nr:unnamed protein product [Brachionus calyciflorus]
MENLCELFDNLSLKLNLIKSSRSKKDGTPSWLLVDDEKHEYKTSYVNKNGKITWRCNNTEFPNCSGAVYTNGHSGPIFKIRDHEHCSTIKTEIKAIKANIKDLAEKQPDTNPRKIIIECQKNVSEEIAANLPSYSSSRQLCRNAREDPFENYKIPENLDFELHQDFTITLKNENFIFFDSFDPSKKNNDRIIIFATEKNLQLLSKFRHWLCDGTFDAAPKLFKQLFTIHVIINEVFPDAEIFGCFFHLKKNIWRHIQEDGLSVEYCESKIEENTVRLYSKMLACLAFVPVEDTVMVFELLKKNCPNRLEKLYKYFEDFYIGPMSRGRNPKRKSPLFDIEMWSCHKRTVLGLPRTNNNLEGWHNALQSSIKTHPHLLSFINSIKLEQSNSENLYAQLCSGLARR